MIPIPIDIFSCSVVQHMTAGDRAFPAKFHLKDLDPRDVKELRRIRKIVETSAIRWPVLQRSSPLYPRDIIEEMRDKVLKKDENYRQRLAANEAKSTIACKPWKEKYGPRPSSLSSIPQPAQAAEVESFQTRELPSKEPEYLGLKGKGKSDIID